jgi:hypothetical protein
VATGGGSSTCDCRMVRSHAREEAKREEALESLSENEGFHVVHRPGRRKGHPRGSTVSSRPLIHSRASTHVGRTRRTSCVLENPWGASVALTLIEGVSCQWELFLQAKETHQLVNIRLPNATTSSASCLVGAEGSSNEPALVLPDGVARQAIHVEHAPDGRFLGSAVGAGI